MASVPAASSAEPNSLDYNFDSEPTPAAGQDLAAPMNLQADNGLDFKLDDLELPSLDVDKHDVANAPPVIDSGELDFDLGSFDETPAPTVAAGEIGRASGRERVCQYVEMLVARVALNKNQ